MDMHHMNDHLDIFEFPPNKTLEPDVKKKGYPMHNSERTLYLNCSFDSPYCFTYGVHNTLF